jgi:hypothetical protein
VVLPGWSGLTFQQDCRIIICANNLNPSLNKSPSSELHAKFQGKMFNRESGPIAKDNFKTVNINYVYD